MRARGAPAAGSASANQREQAGQQDSQGYFPDGDQHGNIDGKLVEIS
ncbi:MAG: hypothetical protein R3C12_02790 [Planctomycetaceae bacterium]